MNCLYSFHHFLSLIDELQFTSVSLEVLVLFFSIYANFSISYFFPTDDSHFFFGRREFCYFNLFKEFISKKLVLRI